MSIVTSRDAARIRILTCEPLPAAPTRRRKPVGVGALVLALVGVSAVLAVRSATPPSGPTAAMVQPEVPVKVVGSAGATVFHHNRAVQRWMRSAVSSDFPAAARAAAARAQQQRIVSPPAYTPSAAVVTGPPPVFTPRTAQPQAAAQPQSQPPAQPAPQRQAPSVELKPDS